MLTPQFALTLLVLMVALLLTARMIILEKRPRKDLKPRLIPTTPVMIASGFVALLAFIHLINLVGIHTGRYH
jgi:amino acid transporter